ncbi:MAG TPA: alpha-L-fucosidase [Gemmatimonadales bacterium]|nr:alpha-L-fucosidase [Gemmatimonadales bacterium]
MSDVSRRGFVLAGAAALSAGGLRLRPGPPRRPRPTAAQLAWQRDELAMFVHFGVNTFTDREWGDGRESPSIFAPGRLDARQWARTARAAGFRAMILTAKHHDGFCLWPSATTAHSVRSSPWRGGAGDVVREFVDACRAEGLRPGLYLSPWDRNAPVYGDSPRYNDFYVDQLTELLTRYGPLAQMWFDGANGEGPGGRRQEYDWPRFFGTVRRLQPGAVIFSDAGPDVRWIGNERGVAGDPNWSTVDPAAVPYPGVWSDAVRDALQHGDPDGSVWRPGETDTSIRPGWFYHPAEDGKVKTVDELLRIHLESVGRNSKLLLNVPPAPDGRLHPADVARLTDFRARLDDRFGHDLASGRRVRWRRAGQRTAEARLDFTRAERVGLVRLEEDIAGGQDVARYRVEGRDGRDWRELCRGRTIGYRKIDRFEPVEVRGLRVVIEDAVAPPRPLRIGAYRG